MQQLQNRSTGSIEYDCMVRRFLRDHMHAALITWLLFLDSTVEADDRVGMIKRWCSYRVVAASCRWSVRLHSSCNVAEELGDGFVRNRIDAHVTKLFLQPRVPMILDVVVRSPWHPCSYQRPSVIETPPMKKNPVWKVKTQSMFAYKKTSACLEAGSPSHQLVLPKLDIILHVSSSCCTLLQQ